MYGDDDRMHIEFTIGESESRLVGRVGRCSRRRAGAQEATRVDRWTGGPGGRWTRLEWLDWVDWMGWDGVWVEYKKMIERAGDRHSPS